MTTIALIALGPNDPKQAQQAVPDGGQPSASFADLLDGTQKPEEKTHKAERPHRVYSFAELGMFGLHELVLPPDSSQGGKSADAGAVKLAGVSPPAAERKPAASGAQPVSAAPLVYVPFIEADPAMGNTVMDVTPPQGGSKGPAGTIVTRSFAGGSTVDPLNPPPRGSTPSPGDAKAQALRAATKAPDPVSVTVSGPDEALQIAVRSSEPSPPEVTTLRRLIQSTVADFEMDVAQLHVNGSAIENVFSLGGANGSSAR